MATSPRIKMRACKTLSGLAVPRASFPEAASQTFVAGEPVYLVAGYLTACPANPTLIMGIATEDAHNDGSSGTYNILVELAHPDTLFLGNMDHGDDQGNGVTAAANLGKMYGITETTSTKYWFLDTDIVSGANSRVVCWQHWLQDGEVVGDKLGRVLFSFDPHYFQGMRTS